MKRNPSLDFLRGIAIIMVMFNHISLLQKSQAQGLPLSLLRLPFSALATGGWCGVDLFFVLSGFLISSLLFNEYQDTGRLLVGRFLVRRGFKIYPNFIFFIGLTFVIEKVFQYNVSGEIYPAIAYVKDLFFLHNYFGGRWIITWSLDVEEAFYFLLPGYLLLLISLNKLSAKSMLITYSILLISGIILRLLINISHPVYDFQMHYTYTHFRLDGLYLGVLLSYLFHHQSGFKAFIKKHQINIIVVSLLLILPNFLFKRALNNWISIVFLATNPIAFGGLIISALESKSLFLKNKFLVYIGRHSYAIYLWHTFVNAYAIKLCLVNGSIANYLLYLITYFSASIFFGILITQLIEIPFLIIRNKYFPGRIEVI